MTKSAKKISLLFIVLLTLFLLGGLFLLFQDREGPQITFSHTFESISPDLPVFVTVHDSASSVKSVDIRVRFQENEVPITLQTYSEGKQEQTVPFSLANAGLKNNDVFDLEITATDGSFGGFGFGNKNTVILPLRLDTSPPRISIKSSTPYVRKGGAACVVYSLSKEVRQTGVKVNELFFPAFRQDNGEYLCFFAFPYFMDNKDFNPQLAALDRAGNLNTIDLPVTRMNRQFKQDSIAISQAFLDEKAAEFESMVPGDMSDIERFLAVNGRLRRENAAALLEMGKNTAPRVLWQGSFLRLPRAASRAGFADRRSYLWEGQKIDEQTHLGFDLASLKQAPVPAANGGTVVFTGSLGIYGKLVVIDHGLGLQSLYSHLSEISVENGQQLNKGDILGKTGTSGMAGGDHLHFGILLSGLEVTPLEWLDDHWIKDNVIDRAKEAGIALPEFIPSPPAEAPAEKKKAPVRKARPGQKRP